MKYSARRTVLAAVIGSLPMVGGLGGCSQTSRETRQAIGLYQQGNFAAAAQMLQPATQKKDENFVLANCRYGSCALAAGDMAGAEDAFQAAYEVINGVKTNDGGRTLGATIVFEGIKVWKGEPFERAMANYYLGLIYLFKNDYGTARAAFQTSLFKVREYANTDDPSKYTEAESNFALGYFGVGFCEMRMGHAAAAQENFKLAMTKNPGLATLIADVQKPGVNTLIFIDQGWGPRKGAKGWYDEESYFGPRPEQVGPIPSMMTTIDGRAVINPQAQYWTVDTLAMAQDRHWQDIDTLRKAKAVIGTGLMAGGAAAAGYGADRRDKGTMWAGIGAMAAGALLSASSQSDVRSWEMLPRTVYIVPAALPAGPHTIQVNIGGAQNLQLPTTIQAGVPGKPHDNVFYFRM